MDSLFAARSIGISELRESPAKAFEQAGNGAVVVLNHNKPAGYLVSPRLMAKVLDALADRLIEGKTGARLNSLGKARRISIDDL